MKFYTLLLTSLLSFTLRAELLGSEFTYQGELKDINGNVHDGEFDFNFKIYSDIDGNNQLGNAYNVQNVLVSQGIFTTQLDFGDTYFIGDKVWLEINIRDGNSNGGYTQLLPLQQITSIPYATQAQYVSVNSVSSNEIIDGSIVTSDMADASIDSDKILDSSIATVDYQDNSITSTKIQAPLSLSASIIGNSNNPPEDTAVIAGVNTAVVSYNIFGIYGTSSGSFPPNGNIPAYPAGVYGHGTFDAYGVKGTAGDISGFDYPTGSVGVVGIGQSRGVVAISNSGMGMNSNSVSNYGVWGQSNEYRGVTGRTSRSDSNYGIFTPDNLFSNNYTLRGSISKIFKYNGSSELKPGDVVSFSGIAQGQKQTDAPVVLVKNIHNNPNASIAGVVQSRFNIDSVSDDETLNNTNTDKDPTPTGAVQPGEYLLVVIEGPAKINLDADKSQYTMGGLLVFEPANGKIRNTNNSSINSEGHIIGSYLGSMADDNTSTFVYVSVK